VKEGWERGHPPLQLELDTLAKLVRPVSRGRVVAVELLVARLYSRVHRGWGELPAAWRRIAMLLDLVNLCEFLNALGQGGTRVDDVTRLIRATIEHFEASAVGER